MIRFTIVNNFSKISNSALTEFLNEQNIQARVIRERYLNLQVQNGTNDEQLSVEEQQPSHGVSEEDEDGGESDSDDGDIDEDTTKSPQNSQPIPGSESDSEPETATTKLEVGGSKKRLTKKQQEKLIKKQKKELDESDSEDRRRPRRRRGIYQNYENDEQIFRNRNKNLGRLPGETDFCALCHCKFTVTVYSESAPQEIQEKYREEQELKMQQKLKQKLEQKLLRDAMKQESDEFEGNDENDTSSSGSDNEMDLTTEKQKRKPWLLLLCPACSKDELEKGKVSRETLAHDEALKTSKLYRRKVAAALLDRKEFSSVPKLQNICTKVVTDHIEDVEALGSLNFYNRDKIARILTRNRKLNSETLPLFFDNGIKRLELWDCSQIDSQSLALIPSNCPSLESITLSMCGQLKYNFLSSCSCINVTELCLDGAFLISSEDWCNFFREMKTTLLRLDIRNTHRFDSVAMATLVEECTNLTHLSLSRVSGLVDPAAYLLLPELRNLVHLEISHPPQEIIMAKDVELITDEIVISILNSVGSQLQSLVLDGCAELTDKFVTDGLRPCCSPLRLQKLSLNSLDQISDEVMADLFHTWQDELGSLYNGPIMTELSLERCIGLTDNCITAMFEFVRPSIVSLNINSLPDLSGKPFEEIFIGADKSLFKALQSLNLSFVRSIDNTLITSIIDKSPRLEFIEVFGIPGVNKNCAVRPGVKLIGRQDALDL